MPEIFSQDGLFGRYPFLLPNLIVSAANFIGFVSVIIFLQETDTSYESIKMDDMSKTMNEDQIELIEEQDVEDGDKAPIEQVTLESMESSDVTLASAPASSSLASTIRNMLLQLSSAKVITTIQCHLTVV